jgi:hypothetical protein
MDQHFFPRAACALTSQATLYEVGEGREGPDAGANAAQKQNRSAKRRPPHLIALAP